MILGIDLGSVHVGLVLAAEALPLRPVAATLTVDPADLGAVAASIVEAARGVERVLVEHGRFYVPAGVTPQAAAAMGQRWGVCERILERLRVALPRTPIETIARQTWAHRVVPGQGRGITDAMVREALAAHVVDMGALRTQHEVDAAGALVGYLLGPPKRSGAPVAPGKRKRWYTPKMGTKRVKHGHPSDAAFDALMASRG